MTKPFLTLSAALVAAALSAGAAGLAAPPDPAAGPADKAADKSAEKLVTVQLKFDPANPKVPVGIESVTPDPVELSRSQKHYAHWVLAPAKSGTLKITMQDKGGRPFKGHPASRGERDQVYSDPAVFGEDGSRHKYTITVRADGAAADFVLDPIILIRP